MAHSPTDDEGETLDLASKCAVALYSDARYEEAEDLGVQFMQTRRRLFSDERVSTLRSKANLAMVFMAQGREASAQELQIQEVEAEKRLYSDAINANPGHLRARSLPPVTDEA